jgi:hypothetical protein
VDRKTYRELQYLALPTAAALAHIQVVGTPPNALDSAHLRKTIEGVAHSLAMISRIYSMPDPAMAPTEIPPSDLVEGRFTRGGHAFVTSSGAEYTRLVIQRSELNAAITILIKSHARW